MAKKLTRYILIALVLTGMVSYKDLQVGDPLREVHREALVPLEGGEEVRGQRSVVHVGAGDHPRRGAHLARVATIHDQRDPLAELVPVGRYIR